MSITASNLKAVQPVPAHPLDAFPLADIVAEISRRPGGVEALRKLAEEQPGVAVLLDELAQRRSP